MKTKRFLGQDYWAKPLPSFGDIKGKLLIIGLATAARGGNRTGRLFTGDSSEDWVARALYEAVFANIPNSESKNDGLLLKDVFISTAVRCAPPNNTPTSLEIFNCSQYLISELIILDPPIKLVLTLGKIAFDTFCRIRSLPRLRFGHNTSMILVTAKPFWLLIIQVDRIQTPENLHGKKCGYLFIEPQNS